jgi:hypothetical protein
MMNDPRSPQQPSRPTGLCEFCRHRRDVQSDRGSSFLLCDRSRIDPALSRYPRLPVVACHGYERAKVG